MFEPVGNKAFLLDPSAVLEEMRTKNPVYRYEKSAVPIVNIFGYHDIRAVLRDVDSFSNTLTGAQQDKASTDPYNLLGMDPPRHRDMREVVKNVFTPGMVRSLEPVIRSHANQIMDTVLDMGEFDAVEDFGAQLSVHLICQLIGVPEEPASWVSTCSGMSKRTRTTSNASPPRCRRCTIILPRKSTTDCANRATMSSLRSLARD